MIATRGLAVAAIAAAAAQIGPGATWLGPVRSRWFPSLDSPMSPGSLALTFDDGPHPQGTPAVLDALDRLGWPATFFVLGSAARRHQDLVREIANRGHEVGVHGYDHRYLFARSPLAQRRDIRDAADLIEDLLDRTPRWWRPPYGVLSGPSLITARAAGLQPLLWSAWGKDWLTNTTPRSIVAVAARGRLDGGTLLLHDSDTQSVPGSWRGTAESLPLLAELIQRLGVTVAPLPNLAV